MDSWDLVLLVVAGYVATVALVRLMTQRRDQMLQRLRKQMEKERQRQRVAEMREQQQQRDRRPEAA